MSCPSEEQLASYVVAAAPGPDAAAVEQHLSTCETCRVWVERALADEAWLKKVQGEIAAHNSEPPSPNAEQTPSPSAAPDATLTIDAAAGRADLDARVTSLPGPEPIEGYEIVKELHRGGQGDLASAGDVHDSADGAISDSEYAAR